jgi:hypothetical protein
MEALPQAEVAVLPPAAPTRPPYKLFAPFQIAGASIFGSPMASAILMAVNYRRLGRPRAAWLVLALGLPVAVIAVATMIATYEKGPWVELLWIWVMWGVARMTQNDIVNKHMDARGQLASGGWMFLISLAVGLPFGFGALYWIEVVHPSEENEGSRYVTIGPEEYVHLWAYGTEDEAFRLGQALTDIGLFGSPGHKTVVIYRSDTDLKLRFLVDSSVVDDAQAQAEFRDLGLYLSATVFDGKPLTICMVDRNPMKVGHVTELRTRLTKTSSSGARRFNIQLRAHGLW